MWSPHTIVPLDEEDLLRPSTTHFSCYGLGWQLRDQHGLKIVGHGGALDGMTSRTVLIPERDFGAVILTNSETGLAQGLSFWITDLVCGAEPEDWSGRFRAARDSEREKAKERQKKDDDARLVLTQPSVPLELFAGRFGSELFGEAEVELVDGSLVLKFANSPTFVGDLSHWHLDTFSIRWRDVPYPFPRGFVRF